MIDTLGKTRVSFPVTVWFEPETGHIRIARPTGHAFTASVSADASSAAGHPQLYRELARVLRLAGAAHPGPGHGVNGH